MIVKLANILEEDIIVHTKDGDLAVKAGAEFEVDECDAQKIIGVFECVRVKEKKKAVEVAVAPVKKVVIKKKKKK